MNKSFTLIFTCIFMTLFASTKVEAQVDQVYWVEGFDTLATAISNTAPPVGVAQPYWASIGSGVWYLYGTYRTNGTVCAGYGVNHLRMSKNINPDFPYFVTPIVSAGVGHLHFTRNQAGRSYAIYWTPDTSALSTNWQLAYTTQSSNITCADTSISINAPTAMRLKIEAAVANLNYDVDSIWVTSFSAIVPVVYSSINAIATNNTVKISWNIETEINTKQYVIERSSDGSQFSSIGALKATGVSKYTWIDNSPIAGTGFYRIRAIDQNGAITYSSIVKVSAGNKLQEIVVAPNPVTGRTLSLQMNNLEKGNYTLNILNSACQKVFGSSVSHPGGSSIQTLTLPASITKGMYYISVSNNAVNFNKTIIVE